MQTQQDSVSAMLQLKVSMTVIDHNNNYYYSSNTVATNSTFPLSLMIVISLSSLFLFLLLLLSTTVLCFCYQKRNLKHTLNTQATGGAQPERPYQEILIDEVNNVPHIYSNLQDSTIGQPPQSDEMYDTIASENEVPQGTAKSRQHLTEAKEVITHSSPHGDTTHPSQQGDTTHPPQQGDTIHPPQQGDTIHLSQQGDTTHPSQQGDTTHPQQQGDTTHPQQQGDTTHPSQQGDTTHPQQQGDTTHPPQQGDTTHPPQQGDTTHPPQQGDTTHLPQQGDTIESSLHGEDSSELYDTLQYTMKNRTSQEDTHTTVDTEGLYHKINTPQATPQALYNSLDVPDNFKHRIVNGSKYTMVTKKCKASTRNVTTTKDICGINKSITTPDSTTESIAPQDTNNELCDTEPCDTEPSDTWDHSVVYQNATSYMGDSETPSKKIQNGPVYTEEEQIT